MAVILFNLVSIELNNAAKALLADLGFDNVFGARPLERIIQKHIKKPLADKLLFGELLNGGHVKVSVNKKKFVLNILPLNKNNSSKIKNDIKA